MLARGSRLLHCGTTFVKQKSPCCCVRYFSAAVEQRDPDDLFNYTSGRWLYNEELRLAERRLPFNVEQLKRVAAEAIGRKEQDVFGIKKFAEGGFNRIFEISMHDGLQVLARLPYPFTLPKKYATASEVATMDFVRQHNVPAPKVFAYSATDKNDVGVEYIIMEKMQGLQAGDVWYTMTDDQRIKLIRELVTLEARLFSIPLPASGSLFYAKDLDPRMKRTEIGDGFCVGPDVQDRAWLDERSGLQINRGSCETSEEILCAGAERELLWAEKYAKPRYPLEPMYRESYNYEKVSPAEHIENLKNYLKIAKHLAPSQESYLNRHTLRHPDPQPNNILISESFTINGLIDWQHCLILPLFLQVKPAKHFQNYGDEESEKCIKPELQKDFDQLNSNEQDVAMELYRRRHTHYHYMSISEELNKDNVRICTHPMIVLKQKLFEHSSTPWEGTNVTLKIDLMTARQMWPFLLRESELATFGSSCPLNYEQAEIDKYLKLHEEQEESDRHMKEIQMGFGMAENGWVPLDMYEDAKERCKTLKSVLLAAVEPGERAMVEKHWPFDNRDEDE
ncbi:hypothetical protein LOZ12_006174 [Ophidiomyces ophidiicola]|nr:hypothetical protein LOZ62_004480 [Ophidiomyces ophidiicola]KAI1952136.1 hypothetical protein LOZ59_005486 [Ophidiomyces ophidiicola]KAI1967554.1 hypothetical protein LOZ56_005520 [Ophidiomyces ophidiicola]KAI2021128.1 hypothetical protein LOZ45_004876 [Ophidiomyces ophidiicola]KAI2023679.1 hypothetical protein LOZ48_005966 [Ophidiomyces ophidiicola]